MKRDELNKKSKEEHPSIAQRKKLEQARKQRLAQALRDNLKKRKEQVRDRKKSMAEKESLQDK